MNKGMTTTKFIEKALRSFNEDEWDSIVLPCAIDWNHSHYNLPDELVKTMFDSLRHLELKLKELNIDSFYGNE